MKDLGREPSDMRISTLLSIIFPTSKSPPVPLGACDDGKAVLPTSILTSLSHIIFSPAPDWTSALLSSWVFSLCDSDAASSASRHSWQIGSRKFLWTVRLTEQLRPGSRSRCCKCRSSSESVVDGDGGKFVGEELSCERFRVYLSDCLDGRDRQSSSILARDSKHLM
jgi:hypothetical protein